MALIVESWPPVSGAESFCSVAQFDLYWTNRNDLVTPALATAAKESALRQATAFLEQNFKWSGERNIVTQALAWPRILPYGLDADRKSVTSTEIPKAIVDATCELAKEALAGSLAPSVARGGQVESTSVGPISVKYAPGASVAKKYQLVELLVKNLLCGGGNNSISGTVRMS